MDSAGSLGLAGIRASDSQVRSFMEKIMHWWRGSHHGHATKQDLDRMEKRIMATAKELADRITTLTTSVGAIGDQLAKAKSEIDKEIQDLKDAVAGGDLSAIETAVTDLETAVGKVTPVSQALDDLNPDVTPPPTP